MEKIKDTPSNLSIGTKVVPALLLDWDGTIRVSKSGKQFIENENDIKLIDNIEKIIWRYRQFNYLIIGISNQGAVSYGYKRPSHIEKEASVTLSLFKQNPFHIVKMCYHMEGGSIEPFNHRSMLRKPNIGMLAIAELDAWEAGYMIDWDKSIFVGDRPEDEQCAKNANIRFHHIDEFLTKPHIFDI